MTNGIDLAPHSIEAEEAVLGAILINPDALDEVSFLRPADFFIVRHGWIFEAINALRERKAPYDYLTVCQELEERGRLAETGGHAYLLNLTLKTPSSLNAEGYAQIVQRMAIRRRLLDAASEIARAAHSEETDIDEVLGKAENAVREVTTIRASSQIATIDKVANSCLARLARAEEARDRGDTLSLKTGIEELDYVADNQITFGRIVQILGASGHFKTTLACRMVPTLATQAPVLFVSQEMPAEDVLDRIACQRANVPSNSITKGTITDVEGQRYRRALMELTGQPIEFMNRRTSVSQITGYVRGMMKRYPGQKVVIFIDTVNTLFGTNHQQGMVDGTSNVAAELEALKLETGALIIGIIQQYVATNEDRAVHLRPSQNNVKYTKALFEKCDLMFGTYFADHWRRQYPNTFDDPKCPKGKLLLLALKNRYGDTDRMKLLDVAPGIPNLRPAAHQLKVVHAAPAPQTA